MKLDEWHLVIVTICIILVIAAFSPLIYTFIPKERERFFALAMLGREGMAEEYFPDDDIDVEKGENVQWTLYIYNHADEVSYLSIRFKLLNSSTLPPNSTFCRASVAPIVHEIKIVLLNNETLYLPIQWSLQDVRVYDNRTIVESLIINEELIQTYVDAFNENLFRFVVELWVYDKELREFSFGWISGDEQICAWNQIWFTISV